LRQKFSILNPESFGVFKHIAMGLAMLAGADYASRAMPLLSWLKRHEALHRADGILRECCASLTLGEKRLGKTARSWIERRRWGSDPAEMRRLIYAAALGARGDTIEAVHFPPRTREDLEAAAEATFEELALEEAVGQKLAHFFERLGSVEAYGVWPAVMAHVERPLIERCLAWARGNQLKASRVLGINRNTLRKKMKALGIQYRSAETSSRERS
jgi:DNA-binding protein Fis